MISFIEKNYFKINMLFLSVISFYCMSGLIVPLQQISANKFVTLGMTLMGVLLGIYNFFIKKAYLKVRKIEYLILFLLMNILTAILVVKYGFSTNIKNLVVFFIYFFAIYPVFHSFTEKKARTLFDLFFSIVTVSNTVGVIISIWQFIMLQGYRVYDYKGLLIRQGFVESRLFGILASPNYLSIISLMVIIYLWMRLSLYNKIIKTLAILSIVFNFAYIVLSGSRTTYICLVVVALLYALMKANWTQKGKSILTVLVTVSLVFVAYNGIKFTSESYLKANSDLIKKNLANAQNEDKTLSLERTDTSEENISNNRFKIWQSTASFIPKRPFFGYSGGNWYELGKEYDASAYIIREHYLTHNGYLELLFYDGLTGFIPIAVFMLSFIISSLKKYKKDLQEGRHNHELITILLMTVVILISNLFLSSTFYGISLLGCILFVISGYYFSVLYKNRDGYRKLDEAEIKDVELGVMDYIHNLCQKENINYSLAYGTLLGAVRHKGYIPWDDDIDISLKRDEYDKLYQAILRDNDPIYKVVSWENDARYPYPFYRVYDARTVYDNNYIGNDIDLGICVDVFPFDYYTDVNKDMVKLDTYRRLSVYTLYGIHNKNAKLKNIVRYLLVLLFRLTRVKTWNQKMNILSMQEKDGDFIDYLMENKRVSTKFDKSFLDTTIDSPFEDRVYKIPVAYQQILSAIYGDDFMEIPPIEKRVKHDDFLAYIKEGQNVLQWLKRSLASLLGDKKDLVKNLPIIKNLNQKANIDLDSKRSNLLKENFEDILKAIYQSNLKSYDIWLDFGTLLGFYREKDLIPHDLDMDFGIIIPDYEAFLKDEKVLFEQGFVRTKEFYYNDKIVEFSYSYKGLNVDFIVYDKKENTISSDTIFYMTNALGNPTRYEVYHYELPFTALTECRFKEILVKVPENTREYISHLYGEDFEIPNTHYNWKENPIYKQRDAKMAKVLLIKSLGH